MYFITTATVVIKAPHSLVVRMGVCRAGTVIISLTSHIEHGAH